MALAEARQSRGKTALCCTTQETEHVAVSVCVFIRASLCQRACVKSKSSKWTMQNQRKRNKEREDEGDELGGTEPQCEGRRATSRAQTFRNFRDLLPSGGSYRYCPIL